MITLHSRSMLSLAGLFAAVCLSQPVSAAKINASLEFDFTGKGMAKDLVTPGNTISFVDSANIGFNVTARALIGKNQNSVRSGVTVHSGSDYGDYKYSVNKNVSGLGVCGSKNLGGCLSSSKQFGLNDRSTDTREWLLLTFDSDVRFDSLVISPLNKKQGSVTIYSGSVDPFSLKSGKFGEDFGKPYTFDYLRVKGDQAIDIEALRAGNSLLIGAQGVNTAFSVSRVNATVVPVPSAIWLMGSALMLVAARARRDARIG